MNESKRYEELRKKGHTIREATEIMQKEFEQDTIKKSQASIEVLKVNSKLKQASIVLIAGSLFMYGVSLSFPKALLIFTGAMAIAGSYFFFIAHTKEKYLIKKYDLSINTEKFSK